MKSPIIKLFKSQITDGDIADYFETVHGKEIVFCEHGKSWYRLENGWWSPDDEKLIYDILNDLYLRMSKLSYDPYNYRCNFKRIEKLRSLNKLKSYIKMIKMRVAIKEPFWIK